MKKITPLGLFILIVLFAAPIGTGVGLMLGIAWNKGSLSRWQRLPDPPGRPDHILGGSTATVFIKTTDGQVYSYDPVDDKSWIKADQPVPSSPADNSCGEYPMQYTVSAPPGKVIDSFKAQWCEAEVGEETDYVLLEGGSVWTWRHSDANFLNPARAFAAAGGGCGVGLLASLAVSILYWRRERTRQREAPPHA
jgi:hypothetical protein